jgi:hypothetical protein
LKALERAGRTGAPSSQPFAAHDFTDLSGGETLIPLMACGLHLGVCLFSSPSGSEMRFSIRDLWTGEEGARSRATGLVLTQPDGSLSASRAVLRCNRIQLDAKRNRANQPGFSFPALGSRLLALGFRLPGLGSRLSDEVQLIMSGSRNTFSSSSAEANPSGSVPRLYSAIRFFHLRKSVMLCGSTRTSTRRRLASRRFIS